MQIQYVSDLHLEFLKTIPKITPRAKTLVLAGDIGYPHQPIYAAFLKDVSSKFEKVFLIAGNHEYYTQNTCMMEDVDNQIQEIIEKHSLENVSFLNYDYEDYQGVRFVGIPLWSQIKDPKYLINDFVAIKHMSTELYNELHAMGCELIEEMLEHSEIPIVMITHHMPSYQLIDPMYSGPNIAPYNQCFASHCDDLIRDPIVLWIYGHTHQPSDTYINSVRLVCNPKGYPGENQILETTVVTVSSKP